MKLNIIKKIKNFLYYRKIISFNKKVFLNSEFRTKKIILVEFNNFCINHIIYSYFTNILKNKYHANVIAYNAQALLTQEFKLSFFKKSKIFFAKLLKINFFGVYDSFGVKNFYFPSQNEVDKILLKKELKKFYTKVKNLRDLERFKISNILVGDLMYDTYLKAHYKLKPTVELNSKEFKIFAEDFISLFLVWENFILNNDVKAIISSHCVYSLAIPIRIGTKYNIDNFIISPESVFRIKKNFLHQFLEVKYFKNIFNNLKKKDQKFIIRNAKKKIKNKIKGVYSSDYPYITKSPFGHMSEKIAIIKKKKISKKNSNIFMIATHDFVDAPHAMGNSLFTDFYHWFIYLCNLSKKTDDVWLVKTHPAFDGEYKKYIDYERLIVEEICKNFPNIIILPQNITHQQIIKMGVSAVLTVNGTIGIDYPIFGVPVINASKFNPHINYKFNFNPRSIKELKYIILNFNKIKKKVVIKKNEVNEYYGVRNVFFSKDWFFKDLDKIINDVGGYHSIFRPVFYQYWVKNFKLHEADLEKIKIKILNYINNKKNIFLLRHNIGNF